MAFLDKFKGKTQFLTKTDVSGVLGGSTAKYDNSNQSKQPIISTSQKINPQRSPQTNIKNIKITSNNSKHKMVQVNPFCVFNPLYLDQKEKQREDKLRKEKDLKQKMEKERRKKEMQEAKAEEMASKMAESQKINRKQNSSKEWISLGGLGPNLGEDWKKKKEMQEKMQKFASQIKTINLSKMKSLQVPNYSHSAQLKDPRTKALQYSRTIPKPLVFEKPDSCTEFMKKSWSKEDILESELERYESRHRQLKDLLKNM